MFNFFNKQKQMNFDLGQTLRDTVTGFQGIATGKTEYLNGCVQFFIKPKMQEGKMVEGEWIDRQQLEFVDNGITVQKTNTGGPNVDSPKGIGRGKL